MSDDIRPCYDPDFLESVAKLARAIAGAEKSVDREVGLYIKGPIQLVDGGGDVGHGHLEDITDESDWVWFPPVAEVPAPPPPRTMAGVGELILPGSSEHKNGLDHPVQLWAEPDVCDHTDSDASTPIVPDPLEGMFL